MLPASSRPPPCWAAEEVNDIISQPPPITQSSMPAMMDAAAMFTLVMPEPQKRSRVTPEAAVS